MTDNSVIKNQLVEITKEILKIDSVDDDSLYLIISDSVLAITFITTIEEELNIEIDDDDIDINFFSSFDEIICRINKYL